MGRHVSRFGINHPRAGVWEVICPGWDWGLCAGHTFDSKQEARDWITKEEESK